MSSPPDPTPPKKAAQPPHNLAPRRRPPPSPPPHAEPSLKARRLGDPRWNRPSPAFEEHHWDPHAPDSEPHPAHPSSASCTSDSAADEREPSSARAPSPDPRTSPESAVVASATAAAAAASSASVPTSAVARALPLPAPPPSQPLLRPPPPAPPLLAVHEAAVTATAPLLSRAGTPSLSATPVSAFGQPRLTPQPRRNSKGEVRRVWNRRALEASGISLTLLAAIDAFTKDVPHIPTHHDVNRNRKVPVRNMRQWITELEDAAHAPVWEALTRVLSVDSSCKAAWGGQWDHDMCRFILGVLVSEDQTRLGGKQSRQAVNNAIKRELACPIETGSSSKSKTFRDLFREKCRSKGVSVPKLEVSSRASAPLAATPTTMPAGVSALRTASATSAPAFLPTSEESALPPLDLPWYEQEKTTPESLPVLFEQFRSKRPSETVAKRWLERCRETCPERDEWGRTAWWETKSDSTVTLLPFMLAVDSLHRLRDLLVDFRWMIRTFHCVDFEYGMHQLPTQGYDIFLREVREAKLKLPPPEVEGFRLIRNALMTIMPILAKDLARNPKGKTFIAHLATQVVGRLLNHKRRFSTVASLIQSVEAYAPRPWLRPLSPCFRQPRTDVKTAVPSNGLLTPHLIALSEDGTLLATSGTVKSTNVKKKPASKEKVGSVITKKHSIEIWDVEHGRLVFKIKDLPSLARCLAISRDNDCVIAETHHGLHFWHKVLRGGDLTFGPRIDASPRPKAVTSITPTVNAGGLLTATSRSDVSPIITLWETRTGRPVRRFSAVQSIAACLDVSVDGEYFASGHNNGFIHLWHLESKDLFAPEPVLSFKNEGDDPENGQQHVVLRKVNKIGDDKHLRTIGISFYEVEDKRWLAAASAEKDGHKIRVWQLPPRSITMEGKTFVSSLRTAVLSCPNVQDVQWSQNGWFFSAGDDCVARQWSKTEGGEWEARCLDNGQPNRSSAMSTVLLSSGKRSDYVATYVTKSPYVTVWDMSVCREDKRLLEEREFSYRPYFCMEPASVDATDIREWTALDRARDEAMVADGSAKTASTKMRPDTELERRTKGMSRYGDGDIEIREELTRYFRRLHLKNTTKLVGNVETRLKLMLVSPLEVCFEQPVDQGLSGIFHDSTDKVAQEESAAQNAMEMVAIAEPSSIWPRLESDGGAVVAGAEGSRSGMVAALQDGTIGIFELETVKAWDGQEWVWDDSGDEKIKNGEGRPRGAADNTMNVVAPVLAAGVEVGQSTTESTP